MDRRNSDDFAITVARNDAESTEDGRLPPSAHIVHLKGDCKTGGQLAYGRKLMLEGESLLKQLFADSNVDLWKIIPR